MHIYVYIHASQLCIYNYIYIFVQGKRLSVCQYMQAKVYQKLFILSEPFRYRYMYVSNGSNRIYNF